MTENFWDKVRERAYFKHLNNNENDCAEKDWADAYREQVIEEKIREEAFLHSLNNGKNELNNWMAAEREIMERLKFLAFYNHENDINKSPIENWIEAQEIYVKNF